MEVKCTSERQDDGACPERRLMSLRPSPAPSPPLAHPRSHPSSCHTPSFLPPPRVTTNVAAKLVPSIYDPTLVMHALRPAVVTDNDAAGSRRRSGVDAKPDANTQSETSLPPGPSRSFVAVDNGAKRVAKESSTVSTPPHVITSFAIVGSARDVGTYACIGDVTWIGLASPGLDTHTPRT